MNMQKLTLGLRREYWESRKLILLTVAILSVLVILASVMSNLAYRNDAFGNSKEVSVEQSVETASAKLTTKEAAAANSLNSVTPSSVMTQQLRLRTPFRFMSIYIAIAWLVSIFYLLSSLYSDRKDNSILYWKSLPVSETQNVLTKLIFASLGFAAIAIIVAWAVYLSLMVLGLGAFNSLGDAEDWQFVGRVFDFSRLFVRPIVATIFGLLWGAPLFCYALMISAIAKRMTLLNMIGSLVGIAVLEGIFLDESIIMSFFTSHLPFAALKVMSDSATISEFYQYFLVEQLASLILGLMLSAVFVFIAVWCRNNRFET